MLAKWKSLACHVIDKHSGDTTHRAYAHGPLVGDARYKKWMKAGIVFHFL